MAAPKKKKKPRTAKKAAWRSSLKKRLTQPGMLLVAAGIVLGVTLVILGILFIGPANRTPDGRLLLERSHPDAPAARTTQAFEKRAPVDAAPAPRKPPAAPSEAVPAAVQEPGVAYEEHFTGKADLSPEMEVVREYRGAVVAPAEPAPPQAAPQPAAPPPSLSAPRMAVVIDDLGDSVAFAKELLRLGFPVTMAVMPYRAHTSEVDALAARNGAQVLLHQPMQPQGYPGVNPGRGALLIGMGPERIQDILDENLAQTPHASGVNNHMGSRFTEDAAGMAVVLTHLGEKNLFFLDSLTTGKSMVPAATAKTGGEYRRRYVFLDNVRDVRAILRQLKTTEALALKSGQALAIGHPYPETLEALRAFAASRDTRVSMVTAGEMAPEAIRNGKTAARMD
jgi:polysaccharide deacetylase 2 family uncharacterized protein YibQ